MKQFATILVFIAILLQTYNKAVVVAQYYCNQDYIAKNLCVNRDKPMMHCNGKCHLKKQLEKQDQPSSNDQKDKQEVNLFCSNSPINIVHVPDFILPNKYFMYDVLTTASYSPSIFHPPATV